MLINKKLAAAIATGSIVVNAFFATSAFAATPVVVTSNGALSNSSVDVNSTHTTTAEQTNTANVSNDITANANTGGNTQSLNTGGNNVVETGNASNDVQVVNMLNHNQLSLPMNSNTDQGGVVGVTGNGAFSANGVSVDNNNSTATFQTNDANVMNNVDANAKTGLNDQSLNTGGTNLTLTGSAMNSTGVMTQANANVANIGGGLGSGLGGGNNVVVSGNGAEGYTNVDLMNNQTTQAVQDNQAYVSNYITGGAKTGQNSNDLNTGGANIIETGRALNNTVVNNLANLNQLNLGATGGMNDGLVKVAGNGAYGSQDVTASTNNTLSAFHTNSADLYNSVNPHATTGDNSMAESTGSVYSDPSILTGSSTSRTVVQNEANANMFNGMNMSVGGQTYQLGFDMGGLLAGMGF